MTGRVDTRRQAILPLQVFGSSGQMLRVPAVIDTGYNGWDGQRRQVVVLSVEGDPLVGTALLDGCRLEIEYRDGGTVNVGPLP